MEVLVVGLQERSKVEMREERKRLSTVDNHGMKISDLEGTLVSLPLVEAKFSKED